MEEIQQMQEKFVIFATEQDGFDLEQSLEEMAELIRTTGGEVCGFLTQKRERPHPGHYLGSGKVAELSDLVSLHEATGVVCDDELSNTQIRNLSDMLDVKILDRTMVILEIFANRATSLEGKLQVELAQQRYRLSHLTGIGKSLSRQGGGIGTKGPGEKKLETDRRHIRARIQELSEKLSDIEGHRKLLREKRERRSEIVVSLVGYTNAGKSTTMNYFTKAEVIASNKLFQTLDATSRSMELGGASTVILTDTVGFIDKLPHGLVKAFRQTLDELKYSDIILHVVDASNPARQKHMEVVYDTLSEIGAMDKPIVTVYNKMDLDIEYPLPFDRYARKVVKLSAKTGQGEEALISAIEDVLKSLRQKITALIPYAEGALIDRLRRKSEVIHEEYKEDGVFVEAYVDSEIYNRLLKYSNSV